MATRVTDDRAKKSSKNLTGLELGESGWKGREGKVSDTFKEFY